MLEKDLRKHGEKYLKAKEAFVFHPHGGGVQRMGLPDTIFCYQGRFCAVEWKLPGKEHTLTKLQAVTLQRIRDAGGIAEMFSSVKQLRDLIHDIDVGAR